MGPVVFIDEIKKLIMREGLVWIEEISTLVRCKNHHDNQPNKWSVEPTIWHPAVDFIGSYIIAENETALLESLTNIASNSTNPLNVDAAIQYKNNKAEYLDNAKNCIVKNPGVMIDKKWIKKLF